MFRQLWMTGILVAFSAFAIKAGLGLGAQVYNKSVSLGKKAFFLSGCFLTYLLLFFFMYFLVTRFNLLNYLDHLANMMQYGILVHLLVALGLFVWGAQLLFKNPKAQNGLPLHASLLLVVPCPVCGTVILLNLTLAFSLSSVTPLVTTLALFGMFSAIIVATLGIVFPLRQRIGSGNSFLGLSMTLISLYFLFTVIIAPIYPEIKAAFAMAVSNSPVNQIDQVPTAIFIVISFALAGTGFIRTYFIKGGVH